ncbi:hypothetical protein P910_003238 [Xylella fastidiosa Mul-MD]|nr:hypothetical protein P910_003238 [Xylella fastidiosa Mul-MD]
MNAINELIDKAREKCCIPSDKALADKIGVTRQVLWQARNERGPLSDERIAQLCAMAKLDGPAWIAKIHAERAASQTERAMWKSMLERLTATAATLIAGAGVSSSNVSYASIGNKEEFKQPDKLVGRAGIEPATNGLKVRCSTD